jgi:hypothetical protein
MMKDLTMKLHDAKFASMDARTVPRHRAAGAGANGSTKRGGGSRGGH